MPADIVYQDRNFIVIKNIRPVAPIHLLLIPKKHIPSIQHLKPEDKSLIGELFLIAKKVAEKEKIAKKGYKLAFNVGKGGGQVINHIHLHMLAGWQTLKERDLPGMP